MTLTITMSDISKEQRDSEWHCEVIVPMLTTSIIRERCQRSIVLKYDYEDGVGKEQY